MAESEVKLTIGEEHVKPGDVTKGQNIDLKFRDPEHLHDRLKVHTCNDEIKQSWQLSKCKESQASSQRQEILLIWRWHPVV